MRERLCLETTRRGRPLRCRGMENEVVDSTDQAPEAPVEVIEELLVEEISIDGMCGVY